MDDHKTKRRELFFANLLCLGFDPVRMESKHNIKFCRDMFNVPNQKAFEIVTYFLLSKLNCPRLKEEFRNCWPIFDKRTEQLFRKTTFYWLQQISQEDIEIPFPHFTLSTLMSPGGEKFYELYFALSLYIVQKILILKKSIKCFHGMPTLTCNSAKRLLQMSLHLSIQRFLNIQKKALLLHKCWHDYISHLVQKYRFLKNQIKEKNKLLMEAKLSLKINYSQNSMDLLLSNISVENVFKIWSTELEKVRKNIKELLEFHSQEVLCWKIIYPELVSSTIFKRCLDGSKLNLKLTNSMKDDYRNKLLKRGVEKTHNKDGQLDLTSVLQILNVTLLEYKAHFSDDIQKILQKYLSQVNTCNSAHNIISNSLRLLSSKLFVSLLPDVKGSVKFLKSSIPIATAPVLLDVQGVTLEPLPPSPLISFSPSNEFNPCIVNFELTPPTGNTPEMVLRKRCLHGCSPLLNDSLGSSHINKFWLDKDERNQYSSTDRIAPFVLENDFWKTKQQNVQLPCSNYVSKEEDSYLGKIVNIMNKNCCAPSYEAEQTATAVEQTKSPRKTYDIGDSTNNCFSNTSEKIPPLDEICALLDSVCSPKSNFKESCLPVLIEGETFVAQLPSCENVTSFSESDEDLKDITLPTIPLIDLDIDFQVLPCTSEPLSPLKELICTPISLPSDVATHNYYSKEMKNYYTEELLPIPEFSTTHDIKVQNLSTEQETEIKFGSSIQKNEESYILLKSNIDVVQEKRHKLQLDSLKNNDDKTKDKFGLLPSQKSAEPNIGILVEI